MKQFKERIGAFRQSPNVRALKMWHSLCPQFFPLRAAEALFGNLSPYFSLWFSAEIINELLGGRDRNRLIALMLITVTGNLAISVVSHILNRAAGHANYLLNQRESAAFMRKTLTLDYQDLESPDVRQLRRKITENGKINGYGRDLLINMVCWAMDETVNFVLSLLLSIEMLVKIFTAGFSVRALGFVVLLLAAFALHTRLMSVFSEKTSSLVDDIGKTMLDENRVEGGIDVYNMGKDIRLYRQDAIILKIKEKLLDAHAEVNRKYYTFQYITDAPIFAGEYFVEGLVYAFVAMYALTGVLGIGSIVKYSQYISNLFNSVAMFFNIKPNIDNNTRFMEEYLSYFDIPNRMYMGKIPVEKQFLCDGGENENEMEFRNVSFRYPGSDEYALRNVSIKFKVGSRLAVVGQNGSGKTTFIKLMCRLYDPTEGEILLNGVNIKKYDYAEYLQLFSVVFQDFKLFSFPLGQNIAASEAVDEALAEKSLAAAGFSGRLKKMPAGLGTCLYKDFDENGVEISGGEAQKIALARALYKGSPFMILDEPTAALDPIAEFEIYQSFDNIVKGKTAVYISHRLSSCRFCDRIAVFDMGRIVQTGSHDTLCRADGKYRELWHSQEQYYV